MIGICLLFSSILAALTNQLVSLDSRFGIGVAAAPCASLNTSTAAAGEAELVIVEPVATLDVTTMFDCEDGNFTVLWSDSVNVVGTIFIGNRTTVMIFGDRTTSDTTVDDTTSSTGSPNAVAGNSSSSNEDQVAQLKASRLSLPSGLSSEVVGVGPPDISALSDNVSISGPIFMSTEAVS